MSEEKIFLVEKIEEVGNYRIFYLIPEKGENLKFLPGQFLMLYKLENEKFSNLFRPYSIASSPTKNFIRLVIKMVGGEFTSYLAKIKEGEKLGVKGAYGKGHIENNLIMIAAGSGIAPMLGIIEYLAETNAEGNYLLIYSTKTQSEIVGKEIFEIAQKKCKNFKIVITLTQENESTEWKGERGRISQEMFEKYTKDFPLSSTKVFICGSLEFAKKMKEICLNKNIKEENIYIEAWG